VRWRRSAISVVLAWLLAGCTTSAPADMPPSPQPCAEVYGAQQCLALTDEAAAQSARTRDDVTAIDVVPFPTTQDGFLITRSGGGFNVRLTFRDGTTAETPMCPGVSMGPACSPNQRLEARSSVADGGGYHDVPCPDGSPPHTCGTPLPTFEPAAVAGARPLSVARFQIPIDHVGAYEVTLGEASLPNGVVTVASFEFADDWPLDVSLGEGVAQINLRSLEPDGNPFQNYFDHGWRPGVERAEALLAFEVLWFEKDAVLDIRNVVVR
jgi:hypothetical protein